jgi:hypothetical protein
MDSGTFAAMRAATGPLTSRGVVVQLTLGFTNEPFGLRDVEEAAQVCRYAGRFRRL